MDHWEGATSVFLDALVSKNRLSYSRGHYSSPHSCTHTLFSLLLQITSGVYELTRRPGRLFPSFSISLFILFFFFASLQGMQDLHFPTRGWTPMPQAVEVHSPNRWFTRETPPYSLFFCSFLSSLSFISPFLSYHPSFIHPTNISRPLRAPPGATGKMRR